MKNVNCTTTEFINLSTNIFTAGGIAFVSLLFALDNWGKETCVTISCIALCVGAGSVAVMAVWTLIKKCWWGKEINENTSVVAGRFSCVIISVCLLTVIIPFFVARLEGYTALIH